MSTVTVTPGATTTVNDGTAATLVVRNTGAFAVFLGPWQWKLRPGERAELTPEGQAVTATSQDGTSTLDVTATTATRHLIGLDDLDEDVIGAIDAGGSGDAQPADDDLATIAGLDATQAGVIASDGAGWIRKTYAALKTALSITQTDLGLGNVQNTSDANKPVSTATQTALDLKAPLASPTLTGTPAVPTASAGTSTTQAASTAFVTAAIAALVASSPAALDTLNELAAALGSDPNFATTMATALGLKAPLASPALTGNPTAPTQTAGNNSTRVATTAYVDALAAAVQLLTNKALDSTTTTVADSTDATKKVKFDVSGVTTATTRTVTLPDASMTLVGTLLLQTLVNKIFDDSTTKIQNTADTTKKGVFDASGITTGTTRTFSLPNATGTLVLTGNTGTLTNKTIDGGSNTLTNIPNAAIVTTISSQAGTTYTLVIGDAGTDIQTTATSAVALTIPPNSSVAFAIGTTINVRQMGAGGQVTIGPGAAVTLRAPNGAKTASQYSTVGLVKIATDEWVLTGDTTS